MGDFAQIHFGSGSSTAASAGYRREAIALSNPRVHVSLRLKAVLAEGIRILRCLGDAKDRESKRESEKQGEKVGSLGLWSVEGEWQRFKGSCCVVILMLLGGMIQRPHISSGAPLICWMSLRQLNPAKYWLRPTPSIKSPSKRAGDGPHQPFDTLPLGPSFICTAHLCLTQNQRLIYSFRRLLLALWLVSSSISALWLKTRTFFFPIGAIKEWKVSCRSQLTAKRMKADGNTWGKKRKCARTPTHPHGDSCMRLYKWRTGLKSNAFAL